MQRITVRLSDADFEVLEELAGVVSDEPARSVPELLQYLAHCAADGVRRPGSWERGWLQQATGWEG